jgi:hypothetical protein
VFTTEKSVVSGQGGGVRAFQNQMFGRIDKVFFASCISTPQNKHDVFFLFGYKFYNAIGEPSPTAFGVRIGLMFSNA